MKQNIIKYTLGIAILFAIPSVTKAQQNLTIQQCREKAVKYNKQLKSAAYKKSEAEAYQKVARTAFLPSVEGSLNTIYMPDGIQVETPGYFLPTAESEADAQAGNFSGQSNVWSPGMNLAFDDLTLYMGSLSVNQPIFTGGEILYSNKKANLGVEMAEYGYQLKYDEVIEMTDKAFWQVAKMDANIQLAESYIEMLADLNDQITKMYELGLTPESEKLKVNVQKNEAELQLLKVKNGLKLSKMYLNQLLGQDLDTPINIAYDSSDYKIFDFSNGSEQALLNRNEIKVLKDQVQLAEYDKKIARAEYLPTIGVGFQYSGTYIKDMTDNTEYTPMIAAQISIPIFAWGQGRNKQKAAEFAIMQKQEELAYSMESISLQVLQVQVQLEEAYDAVELAKKNIAEAEESLDETKTSFELGLNSTTDVLNAQANLQKAKVQYIEASTDVKTLETTWQKVTGNLYSN